MAYRLLWHLVLALLLLSCPCSFKKDNDESLDDYTIYELIDRMILLTGHQTFYDLLNVPETAEKAAISTAFHSKSREWHPDRNRSDPSAPEKSAVLSQVATLLRNEDSRRRYDWILNEAPYWHKSGYLVKKYYMTAKLSLSEVLLIAAVFITLIQILSYLAVRFEQFLRRWNANRTLNNLNKSETKRLERKLEKVSEITEEMRAQSPMLEVWLVANQAPPTFSWSQLWIIRLPLFLLSIPTYLRAFIKKRKIQ